ncbi:MAG: hypothetical protein AB7F21_05510 [Desulfuromonadales bacterium]
MKGIYFLAVIFFICSNHVFADQDAFFSNDGMGTTYSEMIQCEKFSKMYQKYINKSFETSAKNLREYSELIEELGFIKGYISGVNLTLNRKTSSLGNLDFDRFVLEYCNENPTNTTMDAVYTIDNLLTLKAKSN